MYGAVFKPGAVRDGSGPNKEPMLTNMEHNLTNPEPNLTNLEPKLAQELSCLFCSWLAFLRLPLLPVPSGAPGR